jgi:catechol 2,3-dioxygenase-like lactoylglutathione lyase family enzyme
MMLTPFLSPGLRQGRTVTIAKRISRSILVPAGGILVIKGIDHVALVTTGVERAAKFYKELLGFHETGRLETTHSGTIIFIALDGTQIELFGGGKPRPEGEQGRAVGLTHLALLVEDIDAECERMGKLGVAFDMKPTSVESGLRIAFFKDPDGNAVELMQRPRV